MSTPRHTPSPAHPSGWSGPKPPNTPSDPVSKQPARPSGFAAFGAWKSLAGGVPDVGFDYLGSLIPYRASGTLMTAANNIYALGNLKESIWVSKIEFIWDPQSTGGTAPRRFIVLDDTVVFNDSVEDNQGAIVYTSQYDTTPIPSYTDPAASPEVWDSLLTPLILDTPVLLTPQMLWFGIEFEEGSSNGRSIRYSTRNEHDGVIESPVLTENRHELLRSSSTRLSGTLVSGCFPFNIYGSLA